MNRRIQQVFILVICVISPTRVTYAGTIASSCVDAIAELSPSVGYFLEGNLRSSLGRTFFPNAGLPALRLRRTLGIEIEGQSTENRSDLPFRMSEMWNKYAPMYPAMAAGYQVYFPHRNPFQSARIETKEDRTIRALPGLTPVELASPILASADQLNLYADYISMLQTNGLFEAQPRTGGTHFHLGVPDLTSAELLLVAGGFERIRKSIRRAAHISPQRKIYVRPLKTAGFEYLSPLDSVDVVASRMAKEKHFDLNPLSFAEHGTLELRVFNATTNPDILNSVGSFYGDFVMNLRVLNQELLQILARQRDVSIDEVGRLLGHAGLKEKYLRDRTVGEYEASRRQYDENVPFMQRTWEAIDRVLAP